MQKSISLSKRRYGIINEVITLSCKKGRNTNKSMWQIAKIMQMPLHWKSTLKIILQSVYGRNSLKYLQKEYGILDEQGNNYFLDYLLRTKAWRLSAVEENGVTYHHPQQIGLERYRRQLCKNKIHVPNGELSYIVFLQKIVDLKIEIEDDIKTFSVKIPMSLKKMDSLLIVW